MKKVKIIAEIGPNHNGNINLAKKLILKAKICGADYVKFQTFITEDVITKNAEKAKYQSVGGNKMSVDADNNVNEIVGVVKKSIKSFII